MSSKYLFCMINLETCFWGFVPRRGYRGAGALWSFWAGTCSCFLLGLGLTALCFLMRNRPGSAVRNLTFSQDRE